MEINEITSELKKHGSSKNLEGMMRFGINPINGIGVPIPFIRKLAKQIGKNDELALKLWETKIHENRLLACMISNPVNVTKSQMNKWVKDFYSWDICDQVCNNLFVFTPFAYEKAVEWSSNEKEFIKRAGFVLMATLAVHSKNLSDIDFINLFPIIKKESNDERNFVKKAVNWALRQIGKRNINLNNKSVSLAEEILQINSKAAKWIAKDALKELTNPGTRIRNKFI
ncbi:MAG: DNA alkylation repair protein [Bacteroidetes bacterium]|nr:DNA alkylation repair protein [Bacteroidota bacterium]